MAKKIKTSEMKNIFSKEQKELFKKIDFEYYFTKIAYGCVVIFIFVLGLNFLLDGRKIYFIIGLIILVASEFVRDLLGKELKK